jgi:hypothetical protein
VFSHTEVDNTNKHRQPLFCPVYVLEAPLQSDPVIYDKWKARCRVGIYLGRSPSHACSIALVLNLATGRVSPQYHVVFDPAFSTVSELSQEPLPKSDWQRVCGFQGKTSRAERARPADDLLIYIDPADTPGAGKSSPDPPASIPGEAVVPPLEGGTSDSRPSDHEQLGSSMDFTPRDHDQWHDSPAKPSRDKRYYLHIDEDEGFTVWADSDFSGNWDPEHSMHDPNTARSRSGYFITYLGAPLMWKSSLQTKIALSTCEAEYICLSQVLRKVIPIMDLVQELKDKGVPVGGTQPTVKCKMFKDNSAALMLANAPAMRPRTKHINVKYHFF